MYQSSSVNTISTNSGFSHCSPASFCGPPHLIRVGICINLVLLSFLKGHWGFFHLQKRFFNFYIREFWNILRWSISHLNVKENRFWICMFQLFSNDRFSWNISKLVKTQNGTHPHKTRKNIFYGIVDHSTLQHPISNYSVN